MTLVSRLEKGRKLWPECAALALYAAIVAYAIPFHEPWADEAQAWQLARSLPLGSLFANHIRYEGSPGLWHLLLWIMIRCHVSYAGLHWICGAISVLSTAILLFKAPLPRYLRLTLPFTCFLLFQYPIVARNYTLAPLLFFLLAWQWKRSPWRVALLLGLLANLALHSAAIACGLALVYAIEQFRAGSLRARHSRRALLSAACIFACLSLFALWTAWPPHDLLLSRARGESRPVVIDAIASLVLGIGEPWILAVPFWIAIACWFYARRALVYLIPILFFGVFSGIVFFRWWHLGLAIPLLVALLWIAPNPPQDAQPSRSPRCAQAGAAAMIFLIAVQIYWAGYALRYDRFHAYSPDLATAEYLKPFVRQGAAIAVTYVDEDDIRAYLSVGLQPYFGRKLFANQPDDFWSWSESNPTERNFNALLPSHPRVVVVSANPRGGRPVDLQNPKLIRLQHDGYTLAQTFCGSMPARDELETTDCYLVFQYAGRAK
jgi:hypothetical protein